MRNERGAGRKSSITDKELSEIEKRRQSGETISAIAAEYSISRQGLDKRLKAYRDRMTLVTVDYYVGDELCSQIEVNTYMRRVHVINYAREISKRAFGWDEQPDWDQFLEFLEREYYRKQGIDGLHSDVWLCQENRSASFPGPEPLEKERFFFKHSELKIARTDTDGFQMKALTSDRRYFVKSQSVISGVMMADWKVEVLVSKICQLLDIPCVQQHPCKFILDDKEYDGVYSANFELDGYTFVSFERLLERMGTSSKESDFISLGALDKMKWCAKLLVAAMAGAKKSGTDKADADKSYAGKSGTDKSYAGKASNSHKSDMRVVDISEGVECVDAQRLTVAEKYILDLAVIDCLVGNVDRHTRNFGLFFNSYTGKYEIPLIFDNGMGLFEHDSYRDTYDSFEAAMRTVYVSPYGEDPFEMMKLIKGAYDLKAIYPNWDKVADLLTSPECAGYIDVNRFSREYMERMVELWQK